MNDMEDVKDRLVDGTEPQDKTNTLSAGNNGSASYQALETAPNEDRSHEPNHVISSDTSDHYDDRIPMFDTVQYEGRCNFLCNPQSICHKGIALALMCSVGFGSYFCYDNPGALQVPHFY